MKRLTELRKEQRLTQDDLAKKIGSNKRNISNYEVGRSFPNIKLLKRMATYFNVTIDYLVGYSDER
ncbi:helix-turn-helix domain-containing protein [Fructobacillus fructosus]|uniref:helix-turn-helix domain-containing protein n=1 Tax=Fructobacillus fructosus TaxID=1631 RepID=UPI00403463D2